MTNDKPTDALVDGVKTAVVHFGKAAFEVASGVGALFVGITQTVRPGSRDDDESGPERVPVE
jgi:O-acetylhomoserine/O-acetylserine sulfhydrylase-like pyridoxal-dependent enzyme